MPRIPLAELEQLKSSIPLAALVRSAGIELKPHGADLIGHCPFHDDKTPSLVVTPSKNLWHCLGSCGAGGSVVDWVMKKESVDFRAAVDLLKEHYRDSSAAARPAKTSDRKSGLLIAEASEQELLLQVTRFYHERLKQTPGALEYLGSRGLGDEALIDRFSIGFSDRNLGLMVPEKNRVAGAAVRTQMQSVGLMRESGHEHFRGCIVIPVINAAGGVTEMYGRRIGRTRVGGPVHLYLKGPHRGVFNEAGMKQAAESGNRSLILCESLIDALSFIRHGIEHVTASFGINGFTGDHLEALKKYEIEMLLIAYDADEAGDSAAEKLARTLADKLPQLTIKRVRFPKGMDANSFALKMEPANRALRLCLDNAVGLYGLEQARIAVSDTAPPEFLDVDPPRSPASKGEAHRRPGMPVINPAAQTADAPVAAPLLPSPPQSPEPPTTIDDDEIRITVGRRTWRLRGLFDNLSNTTLKVNLACYREGHGVSRAEHIYIDSLDLYFAKARHSFVRYCAEELEEDPRVIKSDMAKILRHAETLWLRHSKESTEEPVPEMTEAERAAAMSLLMDPYLIERITTDFTLCGVVGEETNKLIGYLASVSRKLERPLAILIQSTSAAGKSALMNAILRMMPKEERVEYSAMTGQSVFYLGEKSLKHKILAVAEEEGADKASYALKVLQSEGELSIASTGKDPKSGRLQTQEYHVEGPVMLFMTTTAIDIDEEFLNRCIVLSVDEERKQTKAIHAAQRRSRTLEGLQEQNARSIVVQRHQNAQRLIEGVKILNPLAEDLRFAHSATRTRRDHEKYLTLIDSIALLHQHQRERKSTVDESTGEVVEYIEVTPADIDVANRLAKAVLGRSLDHLPPQTRKLLGLIDAMASKACERLGVEREDYRFSRRDVREYSNWGNTQLKVHLGRLEDLEYLVVHRGSRGRSFVYELGLMGDKPGDIFDYDANWSAGGRPQVGGGRGAEKSSNQLKGNGFSQTRSGISGNAHEEEKRVPGAVDTPAMVVPPSRQKFYAS